MADAGIPTTWKTAWPFLVWVVIVFSFGLEGVVTLVHGDFKVAAISLLGMFAVTAAAIHWERIKAITAVDIGWIALAAAIALVALAYAVYGTQSPVLETLLPVAAIVSMSVATNIFLRVRPAGAEKAQTPAASKIDEQSQTDLLHLLDFGVHQTTFVMLSELVSNTPPIYNVSPDAPLPLELSNKRAQNDAEVYLQLVRRRICDGSDRAVRYEGLWHHAEAMADSFLRKTPLEDRPQGIDPLVLRDYAISFRRAVLTASFLRGERHHIEQTLIGQRQTLIERFRLKNK